MYKYVLNSVVKISVMCAKYFEYYTIILGGHFCGHAVVKHFSVLNVFVFTYLLKWNLKMFSQS